MRARFRKKESRSFFLSICAQLAFNVKTTSFWYDLWAGGNSVIESIKGGLFYENGGERMTVKLRKGSQIPAYMAYPRFLLTMDISETAKLVYVLLLDRARLSMKNEGWEDEQGHVFIYYTIADLASASGTTKDNVKSRENQEKSDRRVLNEQRIVWNLSIGKQAFFPGSRAGKNLRKLGGFL